MAGSLQSSLNAVPATTAVPSPSRLGDFQLAADSAGGAFLDFAVSRHGRDLTIGWILPDGVVAALTNQRAVVRAQVTLQVEPFHEAAS